MTTRQLFLQLADLTTALQGECERLRFSPVKLALEGLRERLDVLLDQIVDEGVQEEGTREEGSRNEGVRE